MNAQRLPASERRDEIVSTARALFAEKGYRATTTRELARAAGISDALLYRHFASKQEVLERVVNDALDAFGSMPPLERLRGLPVAALLTTLGRRFLERAHDNLDLLTLLIAEREALHDTRFAEFIDTAARGLGDELQRRVRSISLENGYLTARSFFGSLIAFVILRETLGMDVVHPVNADRYLDHLVNVTTVALTSD